MVIDTVFIMLVVPFLVSRGVDHSNGSGYALDTKPFETMRLVEGACAN